MKKNDNSLVSIKNYRERKAAQRVTKAIFKQSRWKSQIPRMPRWLDSQEKIWWKRIMQKVDKSILLPVFTITLELLVSALADYDRAKKESEEIGNPLVMKKILRDIRSQISQGLESFLLNPDCLIEEGWLEQVGRKKNSWPKYKLKSRTER